VAVYRGDADCAGHLVNWSILRNAVVGSFEDWLLNGG
jgi:hypothetical protein